MSSELTPEQRRMLWRLFEQGKGAKEIAKEAKIAPAMVDHVLYGKPLRKPKPAAATPEGREEA